MTRLRQRLPRDHGFTMIELLLVVSILAVLLAIAVPTYLGFTDRATDTADAASAHSAAITASAGEAAAPAPPADEAWLEAFRRKHKR
jgi:type IV pilus assembly protein PilA